MVTHIIKILVIPVIVIIAVVGYFILVPSHTEYKTISATSEAFLKNLHGEIVYIYRTGINQDIYTISANGTNKKLIFHSTNLSNANCFNPIWAEGGKKIYFTAMQAGTATISGEWKTFSINPDGSNPALLDNIPADTLTVDSRANDLSVERSSSESSLFYLANNGSKTLIYKQKNGILGAQFSEVPEFASWSPDKNFIIFDTYNDIFISDKSGTELVKITEGSEPDWKY